MQVETSRGGEKLGGGVWAEYRHLPVPWKVSEFVVRAPPRPRAPPFSPLALLSPLPGVSEPGSLCVHSHSAVLQGAGSARAGCWPVQVKTLPLGSWVAAWLQETLLRAAGPIPWGPSHCSWAAGSPPGQAQTKVTAPGAGSTAQEGCPSGGSGDKWAPMGLDQATLPMRQHPWSQRRPGR